MESYLEKRIEKRVERGVKRGFNKFFHGLFFLIFGAALLAALAYVVMLLWNWLLPSIFGITTIDFWQALGILALSKILFGGFGFGKHNFRHKHKHHNRLRERWMKMSDEEREEFLKHRRHFGCRNKNSKIEETEKPD